MTYCAGSGTYTNGRGEVKRCSALTNPDYYHGRPNSYCEGDKGCDHHPLQTDPPTISLAPSMEGYVRIAAMYVERVLADVKGDREATDRELLSQAIKTAAYLAQQGREDLVQQILARLV